MPQPTITPKQLELLILLYRFRFLNRSQLQTLLKHKDTKRINTWLKDLTNKKILGRHYSTKLKENTKPAIYYLMTKSKALLINQPGVDEKLLRRAYREKIRSQKLIGHCLLLADFYLDLIKFSIDEKVHFFSKTDLSTHNYLPFNRPDAYIAREKDATIKRYFLEIIDEGTPRFMLRRKIEQYVEYCNANIWQERTGHTFPTILFLCPNDMIKDFLCKHLAQVMEEEAQAKIDFYLSTTDPIQWASASAD